MAALVKRKDNIQSIPNILTLKCKDLKSCRLLIDKLKKSEDKCSDLTKKRKGIELNITNYKKSVIAELESNLEKQCDDLDSCESLVKIIENNEFKCNDTFNYEHNREKGYEPGTLCEVLHNKKEDILKKINELRNKKPKDVNIIQDKSIESRNILNESILSKDSIPTLNKVNIIPYESIKSINHSPTKPIDKNDKDKEREREEFLTRMGKLWEERQSMKEYKARKKSGGKKYKSNKKSNKKQTKKSRRI